jgi:glucose/arabinose dehydrogenase
MAIDHDDNTATNAKVFASGWLDDETQVAWGRPVDVVNMPDGSILISDDYADVIYRVSYTGN